MIQKIKLANKKRKFYFTIVEVTVAMLVLAILLTIIMQFFDSAQKSWSLSSGKSTIYENARIALGLFNRQIQGIYYEDGVVPFYHKGSDSDPEYPNDSLSFISYLNEPLNADCTSTACEIQYQLYFNTLPDTVQDTAGWMLLSLTGNKEDGGTDNNKWNFYNYVKIFDLDNPGTTDAFTKNNASRNDYIKLIPYVTELAFNCFDDEGNLMTLRNSILPSSIEVTLSLLDRNSWNKWISLGSNGNIGAEGETEVARNFRLKHQQTFTRTIFIGNRI